MALARVTNVWRYREEATDISLSAAPHGQRHWRAYHRPLDVLCLRVPGEADPGQQGHPGRLCELMVGSKSAGV